MMKLNTVLFDFDGTLADTLPLCCEVIRQVFRQFDQRELTDEQVIAMFGPTEEDIIRLNLANQLKAEQAVEQFYSLYMEQHAKLVERPLEIIEFLTFLRGRNLKLGIITGKGRRSLEISLRALRMESLFDDLISGDDVIDPKPHPEGVLAALQHLHSTNEQAIFVGDSNADIAAGKGAGLTTIGVHWLANVQSREFAQAPDYLFTTVDELKQYVLTRIS